MLDKQSNKHPKIELHILLPLPSKLAVKETEKKKAKKKK